MNAFAKWALGLAVVLAIAGPALGGNGFNGVGFPGGGGGGVGIGGPIPGCTAGSVLFCDPANTLAQDNANFSYDNATNTFTLGGNFVPVTNDTQTIGTDLFRWADVFVGPGSVHVGTATGDDAVIAYNTVANRLDTQVIAGVVVSQLVTGLGIGTLTPANVLDVEGSLAVGATYSGTTAAPVNGLLVEGSFGLGTITPANKLDVEGSLAVGATYSGTTAAPANGAIIEGNVGIGQNSSTEKLTVNGNISVPTAGTAVIFSTNYIGNHPNNATIIRANVASLSAYSVIPNGTQVGRNGIYDIFNTDYVVDTTNYEALSFHAHGSGGYAGVASAYVIATKANGTGVHLPIHVGHFTAGEAAVTINATFATSGFTGFGDSSPAALLTVGNGDLFQVDSSGRLFLPAGATGAGNLALSTTGDTNTGIWFPAGDTIAFQTGATDRVTINTTDVTLSVQTIYSAVATDINTPAGEALTLLASGSTGNLVLNPGSNATGALDVNVTSVAGTAEYPIHLSISDSNSTWGVWNESNTNARFDAYVGWFNNTATNASYTHAAIIAAAFDSTSTPVMKFESARGTALIADNALITTRPLFQFLNFGTAVAEVSAGGMWSHAPQTCTCNAGAGVSTCALDINANTVVVVNNDVDGCVVTIADTAAAAANIDGAIGAGICVTTNAGGVVTFPNNAGQWIGPTAVTTTGLDLDDCFSAVYLPGTTDEWRATSDRVQN